VVWLPTWRGWGIVLLLAALALWIIVHRVYFYLAETAPTGHGVLVVEGWIPADAFGGVIETFRRGAYQRLVVTGGPIEDSRCGGGFATYADLGAARVRSLGIDEALLAVVPAPASAQERTFRSAVSVREWTESQNQPISALDVYSYGAHARRSRWLYQQAFGERVAVGVFAGHPTSYAPEAWWRTSVGTEAVLSELVAWGWVRLFFHPGPRGSWEEQWGRDG
jgi:hypothetical protein